MQLLIRLDERGRGGAWRDLVVEVDPRHTVGELADEIGRHVGARADSLWSARLGGELDRDVAVTEAGLISGDVLGLGRSSREHPAPRVRRGVSFDVLSGPAAGSSTTLVPGRYSIGRHPGCDLVVDDPTVSRRHAVVVVADDRTVTIEPIDVARNGVTLDDEPVGGTATVLARQVLALGGTRIALRPFERADDHRVDRLGQIDFQRTPYRPPVVADRPVEVIGPIPARPQQRRFQLLSVLAPLAAGLAMYAFSRQVQFLALTLVSPVMMVGNLVEDRRSGRRTFRDDVAAFRELLDRRLVELDGLRRSERAERFREAPDLADLARRAELRTIDLWPRGRTAHDFLRVRLGLHSDTATFAVELDRGGDDDLRADALAAVDGVTLLHNVPATIDLVDVGVLGVHGPTALVDGLVSSVVVQAACLHSPEDLAIAVAAPPERSLEWVKWLPQVRSVTSPLAGSHLATTRADADRLVLGLLDVATFRSGQGARSDHPNPWPRLLVVLDAALGADPVEVARLLDIAPTVGISVIWMGADASQTPRQATRVLSLRTAPDAMVVGHLWSTDPGEAPRELEIESIRPVLADRVARALAPVRDASTASLATSIPRVVGLLDALGVGTPSAQWVSERWLRARGHELGFTIGMGAAGPVELDLVEDGPHTLIGGTSGAGKSELLQSMVASLASRHSPERLNFLFVDYKGGASSAMFDRLPHTVGYVTNLEAGLAMRALTSLRAELHHRMALMEGRAKDLAEMLAVAPHDAPPSLVIIVDEFATLVKEVPEFVAGIIDIAQRGRSLGIHLVLATQRPSGSVNENILANTNLRISLRMLDRSESTAVIGSPDAADIPVPLKGRAIARLGPHRLVPFQSAYAGAPLVAADVRPPVLVGDFATPDARPVRPASVAAARPEAASQLDAVLDAIVAANAALALPTPRRPWCDALPDIVDLAGVLDDERSLQALRAPGRVVVAGLLDAPERQEQRPALVDLEEGGGLLVFGSGGSGKTTVLRTIAASATLAAARESVPIAVVAFDFASRGLASLTELPSVIDVATGDDLEAVSRHLLVLEAELERRRALLAAAAAEDLTAYQRTVGDPLPRVLVLVDQLGGMLDALHEAGAVGGFAGAEAWVERLSRIVVDGRQVGIHTVIASDRRNAVPARLHAAVSNRLVLRHADEMGYAEHGIPLAAAKDVTLQPGRGFWQGTTFVQVAVVGRDASGRAQADAIRALAAGLPRRSWSSHLVLRSEALGDRVDVDGGTLGAGRPLLETSIGVVDVDGVPAVLDLRWSHAVVLGGPRSGRSTALATVIAGLLDRHDVYAVGPASSPLAGLGLRAAAFGRPEVIAPLLDRIANLVGMGRPTRPLVLVIDDLDSLDDPQLAMHWDRLAASDDLRIVAAMDTRAMNGFTTNPVMAALRRSRRMLVLQPDDPGEFMQATGVKVPHRPGVRMVPGRGVLLADRVPAIVQVVVAAVTDQRDAADQRQISVPA